LDAFLKMRFNPIIEVVKMKRALFMTVGTGVGLDKEKIKG